MKLFLQKRTRRASGEPRPFPNKSKSQAVSLSTSKRLPARIWVELTLGLISALSLTLALVLPSWMEQLFRLAPDGGDGSVERSFALVWAAVSFLMFALAGRTWRKHLRLLRSA